MNILYIIGNGFDLAMGLKTKYEHFYPYYQKCDSPNEAVKLLKKEITENTGDWSDMELALGRFSKMITSENEFTEMYFDLSEKLADYLSQETQRKQFTRNGKIVNDLFQPFLYLESLDRRYYKAHYDLYSDKDRNRTTVNIITLNYSNTIEKVLGYPSNSSSKFFNTYFYVDNICHRHGVLGDTILIGVNDEQQVANEVFKQSQAVRDYLIKPTAIQAMRSENDLICKELINKASIIILYGVSLGATDATLWNDIVQHLDSSLHPLLVYFHYSKSHIPKQRKQLLGTKETEARELLYNRLGVPLKLQSKEKILIGYDKEIFKKNSAVTNQ